MNMWSTSTSTMLRTQKLAQLQKDAFFGSCQLKKLALKSSFEALAQQVI